MALIAARELEHRTDVYPHFPLLSRVLLLFFYFQDYDGGDCCECTCTPPDNSWDDDYACSHYGGFACIDPAASCVEDDDITADMVENCDYVSRRDGYSFVLDYSACFLREIRTQ